MNDAWYELVEAEAKITQGDIIFDCPIITWKSQKTEIKISQPETLKAAIEVIQADVIVMTQACDLENEKVSNIILCPHLALSIYRQQWEESMKQDKQNPTEKAWRRLCDDIKDGYYWNLSMLNQGGTDELKIEHRIVDFHDIYSIPRTFLESFTSQQQRQRLRLLPPYREHLSQAFARYFMRVGLPVSVTKVW